MASKHSSDNIFGYFYKTVIAVFYRLIFYIISRPISFLPSLYLSLFKASVNFHAPSYYLFFRSSWSMYLNALVEKCLRRDFCKSIRLLSYLKVSDYRSTGWFSANSMLLFACFNDLAISSTVRAHGHLSQTTLAFFYQSYQPDLLLILRKRHFAFNLSPKKSRMLIIFGKLLFLEFTFIAPCLLS